MFALVSRPTTLCFPKNIPSLAPEGGTHPRPCYSSRSQKKEAYHIEPIRLHGRAWEEDRSDEADLESKLNTTLSGPRPHVQRTRASEDVLVEEIDLDHDSAFQLFSQRYSAHAEKKGAAGRRHWLM